ncbi:NUDIX hydrolase [Arthrobacter roseus]|uniref:NUDIX hydrolase n=1 Tax=Arthrobacter roseus TaxID=136274 RepID=UPI001964B664|nr:NUDIX domain-containing protein [Arthrobacter roseus]MBM7849364.1 8-oxo-dGTP diphosphatase [Arthrobacter roseus]
MTDSTDTPKVVAAGALCWRLQKGHLQVLLIHRPRYDDWSWPKGKVDAGETPPQAAVREVQEEVGLDISLGVPLPSVRYEVSAGPKIVYYWAAKAEGMTPQPDDDEVDRVLWCSPARAYELLSMTADKLPLDALVNAHSEKRLDTWPLILLRHAKAKPRSSWTRAEGERPLAGSGLRQAKAVGKLLMCWRPKRVRSSPWDRCIQTVIPYIKRSGAKLKHVEAVTEHNAKRKPQKAEAAVRALFDKAKPVVLCTHRPVLPLAFNVIAKHLPEALAGSLPTSDPYLKAGHLLVFQVSSHDRGRIVSVEKHAPYDD